MGIAGRALLFTALTGLVGLASVRILLQGSLPRPGRRGGRLTAGLVLALLGLAAALLLGWGQLQAFRDPFVPWREDAAILLGTPWGRRWLLLVTGFLVSATAFATSRGRVVGWALVPLLAVYPATSGHAAAVAGLTPLTMVLDWVHLLASGAWLGALGVLAWAGRPGGTVSPPLVRILPAFSLQARVAVALVVLTGSVAAAVHLGSVAALSHTHYGRILAGKLGVVGLLLVTGFYNWRVLSREAHTPRGGTRLVRAARLEVGLGAVVLVITAWLTGTAPPG